MAEITLEEAFHGTTRLVDVEGKRLEVTIPPGADTGTRIRLTGKAPGGGDLHRRRPASGRTPTFTRSGADLERELPITLKEALLGAEVPVGRRRARSCSRSRPGTQPGRQFRLAAGACRGSSADGHGDLYVRAKVVLPTDLSDEAREAAQRFFDPVDQPDPR